MNFKFLTAILLSVILGIAVYSTFLLVDFGTPVSAVGNFSFSDTIPNEPDDTLQVDTTRKPEMDIITSYPQDYFVNPMSGKVFVAGSFGELRSNHFHAGLDIRTGGVEGLPVFAAADGYISRINVATYGYGKALYVQHPNGYTTVYGHLQRFNEQIDWFTTKHQYRQESFTVELYPEEELLKVKKGDLIAYSGNTGGSGGPHLHFEIRRTASQDPLNPLLFGLQVEDKIGPEIKHIYLYNLDIDNKIIYGRYPFVSYTARGKQYGISNKIIDLVPGTYGLGADMRDYFLSKAENLGVNYAKVYANNILIYDMTVERVSFAQNRLTNLHMDFANYKLNNQKTTKFFKDKGNALKIYSSMVRDGKITLKDSQVVEIKVVINDVAGFKDSVTFKLRSTKSGRRIQEESLLPGLPDFHFYSTKNNTYTKDDIKVVVPKGALYDDLYLRVTKNDKPVGAVSNAYVVAGIHIPLDLKFTVMLQPDALLTDRLYSKLYMVEWYKGKEYAHNVSVNSGWASATPKDFGTYYLKLDTIKPQITSMVFNPQSKFSFKISDAQSGILSYRAVLDGKWVLMEFEPKTGILEGKPLKKLSQGKHKFELVVKDNTGNTSMFSKEFTI